VIKQLMKLLRRGDQAGMLGIEISPYGLAIAWVDETEGETFGRCHCYYIEGNELEKNGVKLKEYLSTSGYSGVGARVVLHPDLYNIYFIDRPDVADDELKEAVRWKIKDLVDIPLEELLIDAFSLPEDAYGGNQRKAYVVTIKRNEMDRIVQMLGKSGVEIKDVSISELAVENLVQLCEEEQGGAAILQMRNTGGTLNLSDGGNLYLTRAMECGISMIKMGQEDVRQEGLDNLLLEVQRSLDFYDSQLGKGRIRKFLMAPMRIKHKIIDDYLQSNLGVKVVSLNINEMFEVEEEIPNDLQAHCFAAIGAACGEMNRS